MAEPTADGNDQVLTPTVVEDEGPSGPQESVESPGKVMRIGSMI
jgi:hypothetical protein